MARQNSSRSADTKRLRDAIKVFRSQNGAALQTPELEFLARLERSPKAAQALARLKLDQSQEAVVISACLAARHTMESFERRTRDYKYALSKLDRYKKAVRVIRDFVDKTTDPKSTKLEIPQLLFWTLSKHTPAAFSGPGDHKQLVQALFLDFLKEARNSTSAKPKNPDFLFSLVSRYTPAAFTAPGTNTQLLQALVLIAEFVQWRESVIKAAAAELGTTRETRIATAAENSAIWTLAVVVRQLSAGTRWPIAAIADLSEVILQSEVGDNRVRLLIRMREKLFFEMLEERTARLVGSRPNPPDLPLETRSTDRRKK